ncbi:MAG TPA: peptidoglycan recognition family protein [Roseiflexaceae bacterium]|nr:peptidoglycan recognition family protein [Roseiflexaceae bacterium]
MLLMFICGSAGCLTPSGVPQAYAQGRAAQAGPTALQEAFAAAAREFGVPANVLLAVSYNLTRWEDHGGAPSVAGGYGLMHLTQLDQVQTTNARGDDVARARMADPGDLSAHTLNRAATLLGVEPALLKHDLAQNLRGGAGLLAQYAQETVGALPANLTDWYGAVARYSGSQDAVVALDFADAVYTTMQQGAARVTSTGQRVVLAAQNVRANTATVRSLHLRSTQHSAIDCPKGLDCQYVLAAYHWNNLDDATDYGNFDLANRPANGVDIQYIVIHDTEVAYNTTLQGFQRPTAYVSGHYVVRAQDGQVAQMVRNKNIAWHAGNWYFNSHAIGVEHEGVAIEGATWYTEQMYRASARLVRYLAAQYHIPLDRAHIIGHDEIPGPTPAQQAGMHWDPGPFWDWAHYMQLLGAPIGVEGGQPGSNIVTINPDFAHNQPAQTYCYDAETNDCRAVPTQPLNYVYLRAAPDPTAPFVSNPYITDDPTRANNWANKVVAGQKFYRVEQQGDWDAIYFSGQKAWFYNPGHNANTIAGSGILVTPKAGQESIPVCGRAYPEETAYPEGIEPQSITPIYDMPAGQIYVATDLIHGDYFWAPVYAPTLAQAQRATVKGQTMYYRIYFNHRFGFVKASDVDVLSVPASPARQRSHGTP